MRNPICKLLIVALLWPLNGCEQKQKATPEQNASEAKPTSTDTTALPLSPIKFRFADVTRKSGIRYKHNTGAFGTSFLPETMGSGACFIDYDGDGWQDIFFANGRNWTPAEIDAYQKSPVSQSESAFLKARRANLSATSARVIPPRKPSLRTTGTLYRNNHNGTFTDVTQRSGLDKEIYGMGVAVGDYDNDGRPDLCVTSYGRACLFRNITDKSGHPQFREEAVQSGVSDNGWSTCTAFLDYDKDGDLDLFVGQYVQWSPATDIFLSLTGRRKSYGGPMHYPGQSSHLYRNEGRGRFVDVSARAGILSQPAQNGKSGRQLLGKALGVAVCDPNNDGWPDLVVANDMHPNFFFLNNRDGSFKEVGVSSGIALSEKGQPRSGMGIDAADIDHSGRESVAIGNFNSQMLGLYHNRGAGAFDDIAPDSEVGQITNWFLTFGLLFVDIDNDTWPDLLVANGHIDSEVQQFSSAITYAERPLLFLNETQGKSQPKFREIGQQSGAPLAEPLVARGLAAADYDLDGDMDILLTTNGGAPRLWRNDGGNQGNAVRLVLRGTKSNRSALGVKIEAQIGGQKLHRTTRSGSSYLSQNELPVTLGLGDASNIDSLILRWPSGIVTQLKDVTANQIIAINEAKGVVSRRKIGTGIKPSSS